MGAGVTESQCVASDAHMRLCTDLKWIDLVPSTKFDEVTEMCIAGGRALGICILFDVQPLVSTANLCCPSILSR